MAAESAVFREYFGSAAAGKPPDGVNAVSGGRFRTGGANVGFGSKVVASPLVSPMSATRQKRSFAALKGIKKVRRRPKPKAPE